jgi:hypothetical protein
VAALFAPAATVPTVSAQSARNEGCGDFDNQKTHARWTYVVAKADAGRFHARLRQWGTEQGLKVGSVESDGSTTTFLHAPAEAAVIDIRTSSSDNHASIRIFSNCWPPRDDWRRFKQPLSHQLQEWGYRRSE